MSQFVLSVKADSELTGKAHFCPPGERAVGVNGVKIGRKSRVEDDCVGRINSSGLMIS